MKKDDQKTIFFVLAICTVCVLIAFIFSYKTNIKKMSPVNEYGPYFSALREANNYIEYISNKSSNDIINVLDERYINNNNLNIENVLNYYNNYSNFTTLSVNSIDFIKIGKNYLYYLQGILKESMFDMETVIENDFRIVILNDISSMSYSVYPVDNSNFKEVINSIKKINIISNSSNEMVNYNSISYVEVCKMYFSDYISKIVNNIDKAYQLLDDDMLKEMNTVDEFKKYIDDNNFTTSSKLCNFSDTDDGKIYVVVDCNNNIYTFIEEAVMKYRVNIKFDNSRKDYY